MGAVALVYVTKMRLHYTWGRGAYAGYVKDVVKDVVNDYGETFL